MRQIMIENGDAATQIAILEMGWTTDTRSGTPYEWHAVTQEQQAEYLVRAYQYADENWEPWIGLMTTIYFSDVAWTEDNEQFWWALTNPDTTPRPAYYALKRCGLLKNDLDLIDKLFPAFGCHNHLAG